MDRLDGSPIRNRVWTVAREKDHVWCLTLTSLVDGISENNFIGTVNKGNIVAGPLAHSSGNAELTCEKAAHAVVKYLALFAEAVPEHWALGDDKGGFLCTNLGLRALSRLLRELMSFAEGHEYVQLAFLEPDDIVEKTRPYVAPLVAFFKSADAADIQAFRSHGSSLASVTQNCFQMMTIINEALPQFTNGELREYMSTIDKEGTKVAMTLLQEINKNAFRRRGAAAERTLRNGARGMVESWGAADGKG